MAIDTVGQVEVEAEARSVARVAAPAAQAKRREEKP